MSAPRPYPACLAMFDRLEYVNKIAAAFGSTDTALDLPAALKFASDSERKIFERVTNESDYQRECRQLISFFNDRDRFPGANENEPEEQNDSVDVLHSCDREGARNLGRFKHAVHVQSGITSEIYKATVPEESLEIFPGESGRCVALKVTYPHSMQKPHNSERETRILQKLACREIVPLWETFRESSALVLVFPYMQYDLLQVLRKGEGVAERYRRGYLRDMFTALAFLHASGIIHRDVKPSNILMKTLAGPAYLADFGIAWASDDHDSEELFDGKITDVGTAAYRPPEILFGKKNYNHTLDLWAAGCVAAQVITTTSKPLFDSGDLGSDLTLIQSIFKALGTPTTETWPEAETCPDWGRLQWVEYERQTWEELLPKASKEARKVVVDLVKYQSSDRVEANDILGYPYFNASLAESTAPFLL